MARVSCLAAVAVLLAPALVSASGPTGPTTSECVQAADRAQSLQRQSKFIRARNDLRTCASASCPRVVVQQCTNWLEQANEAQPSVVFTAKDGAGGDRSDVHVTVDGDPFTDKLDGTPMEVDPGEHTFTFSVEGRATVTRKVIIAQGEKGRREVVVMSKAPGDGATAVSSDAPLGLGTRRILGLSAAGVGVGGLAVGGVFGLLTFHDASAQKSACPGGVCSTASEHANALSDHSAAITDGTISMVAFIAGGLLVAGGAALFFIPGSSPDHATIQPVLTPSVGLRSAGLSVGGSF